MMKLTAAAILVAAASPAGAADSVMARCGREYLAARSAGTLNGADWTAYRSPCADRLKAAAGVPAPAVSAPTSEAAASSPVPGMPPSSPRNAATASLPTAAAPRDRTAEPGDGRAAMHARQKLCGAEWTDGKVALVLQTPDLTWPKFWSQCNTRLKAAGR